MTRFLLLKNNEQGAAILIALMTIAALSIIGLSAIDTSVNELQIVRNEKIYNLNFYQSEAINQRGMQQLVDAEPNKILNLHPATSPLIFLSKADDIEDVPTADLRIASNWTTGVNCTGRAYDGTFPNNDPDPDGDPNTPDNEERFAVVYDGFAMDDSISMSGSANMHSFKVYGLSQSQTGEVLIEAGFRAKF
jgi:hypothetical protein